LSSPKTEWGKIEGESLLWEIIFEENWVNWNGAICLWMKRREVLNHLDWGNKFICIIEILIELSDLDVLESTFARPQILDDINDFTYQFISLMAFFS
jgi:hypothetical protein